MKLQPGQPLGVSFIFRHEEFPGHPGQWTCHALPSRAGGTMSIGRGFNPGEALTHALLHM